jgi:AcrR family transcriptional regulator
MSDTFLEGAPRARRTQQERKEATRARLLEATLGCLVELGYARTTTQAVVQRAGSSQGALFKHFATKAALLAAAVEHLFPRLIADYRAELATLPAREEERLAQAISLLWRVYHRPELLAAIEVYVAARTDAELARALGAVDPPHRRNLHRVARELFPDVAAAHPHFDALIELILNTVQGAAVGSGALPSNPAHQQMLAMLIHLTRGAFAHPSPSPPPRGAPP